jgi:hypothetical protein
MGDADHGGPRAPETAALLSPARLATQAAGFATGLGFLGWIAYRAAGEGEWERILRAGPVPLLLMCACTMGSALVNGTTFWVTIRPVKRLAFWDLQRLNVAAGMLNYAPLRLGAIARVLYHVRVDGLGLLQLGAWFGLIAYVLVLAAASCAVATVALHRVDWAWAALVGGQMWLGGMALRVAAPLAPTLRVGQSIERMAGDRAALWGAIALRAGDLGAYTGRMAAAAGILGIAMRPSDTILLAMVALAAGLIPFGRLGFREFCVAIAANRLGMTSPHVDAHLHQLALLESAGEALVMIPLGAMALPWLRRRWRSRRSSPAPLTPAPEAAA